eukprot:CAMPEP_0113600024 /NCGR_PEP_ID=MMETSP0015_2-20120614/42478_1 /TAXON_ID=2838 /ORGANISM="Odontella" /LENGTH=476 /DNA_ID=CAMNT_0000508237 /DNA_START=85 /DNA_END=1512 /DNA_ORIENTATION=+ /assembly_acc=CAM_ASM_000160
MRCLRPLFVLVALFPSRASSVDSGSSSFIRKSDLPANGNWVSIKRTVEFLPATSNGRVLDGMDGVMDEALRRQLETSPNNDLDSPYSSQPFVDGESNYDEYQQAWRFLGFMIDCNDGVGDDDDAGDNWDGGTGEGCHRYILWAAYVDMDYEGGGIGEYQYWDRETNSWDDTSCKYGGGTSRCAKMDCHLEDTHWSLLGLFKHKSYDDWMEQLFKHEGFCVWTDEEYAFMKNARNAWPQGCAASGTTGTDGIVIYYDLKPTSGGGMTIGLYSDVHCMEEYKGSITAEDVLGNILAEAGSGSQDNNYDFSDYSLEESLAVWESTFDTWKICHPCVAYDLNNVGYNVDDDASRGSAYSYYNGYNDDYNNGGYNQEDFDCYDNADYTNVNQCMKFMAKTDMSSATLTDMSLASVQGTLVENIPLEGYSNISRGENTTSQWITGIFFVFSSTVLALGVFMFQRVRDEVKAIPGFLNEPFSG